MQEVGTTSLREVVQTAIKTGKRRKAEDDRGNACASAEFIYIQLVLEGS